MHKENIAVFVGDSYTNRKKNYKVGDLVLHQELLMVLTF